MAYNEINSLFENLKNMRKEKTFNPYELSEIEKRIMNKYSLEDIENIQELYKEDYSKSFFNDIINYQQRDFTKERFFYHLELDYYKKIKEIGNESFADILLYGFSTARLCELSLDCEIRHMFIFILNNLLVSSDKYNLSLTVVTELKKLRDELTYKYPDLLVYEFFDYYDSIMDYKQNYLADNILDDYVKNAIDYASSLINTEYYIKDDTDIIKTQKIILQLYLRSIFTILDDDNRLCYYNEYYDKKKNKDQDITDAFINCYFDIKKYSLIQQYFRK